MHFLAILTVIHKTDNVLIFFELRVFGKYATALEYSLAQVL